ncbi:hypothetical protein [Haliangium sp.]|uniref:hypothetical protein n=1 Tax=Haliangium sp. TaxID=2663208 RepID=UPI003D143891
MQTTPACSADERSTVTCEDSDADGCLEETVQEMCTGWCDYFQSQYQCVGCRDDEDCADPIRNRCASAARSCESRPQWSITTLSYSDGASSAQRNYSNCYFCDATYLPSSSHSLIRFQQGGGYTVWSLYVHNGATVGSETLQPGSPATGSYFFLSESDSSLPARFQGSYTQVSGTVNFTQANLADGGAVAGTATVVLQHQTRAESRVTLTANFYARFPP